MEKALFKGIKDFILGKLNETNNRLRIAVAWFTNDEIFQEVLGLLDNHIQVELILIDDCINRNEFGLDFGMFIAKGGHLFFSTSLKNMHNKFCIIDEKLVITGSYNWTYYAENKNWENIIAIDNSSIISNYTEEFDVIKSQLVETKEYSQYRLADVNPIDLLNDYDYLYEDLHYKSDTNGKEYVNYLSAVKESIAIEKRYSVESPLIEATRDKIVTKYSLGIRCMINNRKDSTSSIIPKGTEIPCEKKDIYLTTVDNQTSLECETLLGDNLDANQNRTLGRIVLNDIPPLPMGQGKMEVTFKITTDKMLHVKATNLHTKNSVEANYPLNNII